MESKETASKTNVINGHQQRVVIQRYSVSFDQRQNSSQVAPYFHSDPNSNQSTKWPHPSLTHRASTVAKSVRISKVRGFDFDVVRHQKLFHRMESMSCGQIENCSVFTVNLLDICTMVK